MDFRVDTHSWFIFCLLFICGMLFFIVGFIAISYFGRKKQLKRIRDKVNRKGDNFKQYEQKLIDREFVELGQRNSMLELDLSQMLLNSLGLDSNSAAINTFFAEFDRIHPNFNLTLTDLIPNITEHELKLCSLIRMKLTAKEISRLMNITPASVNKARYRLRKKMDLDPKENLDLFLLKI
ncbi:hypothetical protein MM239_19540 [Belliella sp. DSM 111904]|uniref:HTH luxR-type domain-containing protein n=1 Tax=Belliella filtrata TaxID=2923435 RepID=A0ABS9V5A8_9BACT|nr:hypothetical protein [Belliella filtrata]MCH7411589.1 hypothetical protein [Belliella filtrata]